LRRFYVASKGRDFEEPFVQIDLHAFRLGQEPFPGGAPAHQPARDERANNWLRLQQKTTFTNGSR
jgi:hypothetical protein